MEVTEQEQEEITQLIIDTMNTVKNKHDNDNRDNYILRVKNAIVIWYQPMTLITCVRFVEDKNQNEYHLYNCCHAFLSAGDEVKVFYTTNAAKGWIMARCGKPNFMNEYGQYINDIRNCCDEEDSGENCCDTSCCSEATGRAQNGDTEIVEEWDERIEGSREDILKYEQANENDIFYNFENGGEGK